MPRLSMKKRSAPRVPHESLPEDRCYLCDAVVGRTDQVVRVHDATMHRHCYEQDIRRGR
jgi:hypothetical protein